jgi:hypothetical protein
MGSKKKKKAGGGDGAMWKVAGLIVTITIASVSYYEWQKDRRPAIRYETYQLTGTPGQTALIFAAHYKNIGKTDATDLTVDSRLFAAEQYDPDFPKAKAPHSTGTVGSGIELCPEPHHVDLPNSVAMMSPSVDTKRVWWHDRIYYKNEDGKSQPILDICLVWDRKNQQFVQCPARYASGAFRK